MLVSDQPTLDVLAAWTDDQNHPHRGWPRSGAEEGDSAPPFHITKISVAARPGRSVSIATCTTQWGPTQWGQSHFAKPNHSDPYGFKDDPWVAYQLIFMKPKMVREKHWRQSLSILSVSITTAICQTPAGSSAYLTASSDCFVETLLVTTDGWERKFIEHRPLTVPAEQAPYHQRRHSIADVFRLRRQAHPVVDRALPCALTALPAAGNMAVWLS